MSRQPSGVGKAGETSGRLEAEVMAVMANQSRGSEARTAARA